MKRQAWRDFFVTVFFLGLAFLVALLSSIAAERREDVTAAIAAAVSLLLALIGAIYIIPRLARNVRLEFLRFAVRTSVTVEGVLFFVLLLVIAFSAWNTGNNLLYLVLSALFAFLIASNLVARVSLSDIAVQLRFPDHIFSGEPASLAVTVVNHKRLMPSYSVTVEAVATGDAGGVDEREEEEREATTDGSQENGKTQDSSEAESLPPRLFARLPGRGLGKLAYFMLAPPRSSVRQRIEYTFERRGLYPINGFRVSTKFPTGFFKKWRIIDADGGILVYPKPRPIDDFYHALPMLAGQVHSHLRGSGDDLYAIRRYHPSDHIRNIDWKASAKTREIMVREHMRDDEWRLTIVIDTARPETRGDDSAEFVGLNETLEGGSFNENTEEIRTDQFDEKFERAVVMAASLANHFVLERAHVELVTPSEKSTIPSGSGYEQLYKILRALATLRPEQAPVSKADADPIDRRSWWGRAKTTIDVKKPDAAPSWRRLDEVPVLANERRFKVLITSSPKGTIPAHIWRSSHVVFMEDL